MAIEKVTKIISSEQKVGQEQIATTIRRKQVAARTRSSGFRMGIRNLSKYQLWKGILDRLVALLALVIVSPLLILIAVIIRLDSPGNPFFHQERVGKDGRRFFIYKFRTMHLDHDDSEYEAFLRRYVGGQVNGDGLKEQAKKKIRRRGPDLRVTRFGTLLRKTNLDEIPQLLNILKGEMSFVGPRPDIPFAVAMYKDHHWERFAITPGITGLWQVSRRKKIPFEAMVRLDMDYIKKQSLFLDIKIILLTVRTVLKGEGS
ncbi:MAG: sugar transferase [Dehalococcoidales bacterium]|nr:MAG: sugar transferase [Dehalococcoidales bacterium]